MAKLVYTYWGAGIALGIYGTKAEVEQTANGLYNFEATDSDPIWKSENEEHAFAYVLTTWDKLKKGLTSMYEVGAQFNKGKQRKNLKESAILATAELRATQRIEALESENFLDKTVNTPEVYVIGEKTFAAINS